MVSLSYTWDTEAHDASGLTFTVVGKTRPCEGVLKHRLVCLEKASSCSREVCKPHNASLNDGSTKLNLIRASDEAASEMRGAATRDARGSDADLASKH